MSVLTHFITRRETSAVAAALREAGYPVKTADCYAYVSNVAQHLEPADAQARREVERIIADALPARDA